MDNRDCEYCNRLPDNVIDSQSHAIQKVDSADEQLQGQNRPKPEGERQQWQSVSEDDCQPYVQLYRQRPLDADFECGKTRESLGVVRVIFYRRRGEGNALLR